MKYCKLFKTKKQLLAHLRVDSVIARGITVFLKKMWKVNKQGRSYLPGKAFTDDLKRLIIDKIIEKGGDLVTSFYPGRFTDVRNELGIPFLFYSHDMECAR